MKKLFLILNCVCLSFLIVLPHFNSLEKYPSIAWAVQFVSANKFWVALIPALYILAYTIWPKWLLPRREKKRTIKNTLRQIAAEIFNKDLDNHRITLFKEIGYPRALLRNYIYFFYHLFYGKSKLYIKPPRLGKYLIIDSRCGLQYEKSSTMLRIERNNPEVIPKPSEGG